MTRLAEALRLYLTVKQIDQKKLALAIFTSQSTLSRFISGECMPDAQVMARLFVWLLDDDSKKGL